jgi:hypothetical protein
MYTQTFSQFFNAAGAGSWTAPWNLAFPPLVYSWGGGPAGVAGVGGSRSGAGSGAGSFGGEPALPGVAPGTTLAWTLAVGGTTTVTGGSVNVVGNAGSAGATTVGGNGGVASANTVARAGGNGGGGTNGVSQGGGGGGGSPGPANAANNGAANAGVTGGNGGAAVPGGAAGGKGGTAGGAASAGLAGAVPGAGGGGGADSGTGGFTGGAGTLGQVFVQWTVFILPGLPLRGAQAAGPGRVTATAGRVTATGPVTPSPFTPPRRPLQGPPAARPGRTRPTAGLVTFPATPSPFRAPRAPLRGPPAARPGRQLRPARGTVTATPVVIAGIPPLPGDILKPWRKRAWPRVPFTCELDFPATTPLGIGPDSPGEPGEDPQARAASHPPPGLRVQAEAIVTGLTRRAARTVDTGNVLDADLAESLLYWQQYQKRRKRK